MSVPSPTVTAGPAPLLPFLLLLSQLSMLRCKPPNLSFLPFSLQPNRRENPRNVSLVPTPSLCYQCRVFSLSRANQNPRNSFPSHEEINDKPQEDHQVHCEVDVVSWRERTIRAWVSVSADVESVWSVLTDYERLADFIPNLVCRFVEKLLDFVVFS